MKFIGKIKKAIKQKSKEKISQPEALFEIDAIRAKYNTLDELKAALKGAREFKDAFDRQLNSRRREDRRRFVVKLIGGTFALVGFCGSVFVFIGPFELIFDEWGLGRSLSGVIRVSLAFGFPFLVWITFLWFSDKTGFHYLIEDWIVSFHRYKKFPRNKRRAVIRDTREKLDEISDQLYSLELEADETEDEKLSESVESLNQVIGALITEADISSRSLLHQPEHASWKGFVLALEETSNDLELELKGIAKYSRC